MSSSSVAWEYWVETPSADPDDDRTTVRTDVWSSTMSLQRFEELGAEGWELATMTDEVAVFKRQKFPLAGSKPVRLRLLRDALGGTQRELSLQCGTSQSEISKLERGDVDARLSAVARYLGVLNCKLELAALLPNGRRLVLDLLPEDEEMEVSA